MTTFFCLILGWSLLWANSHQTLIVDLSPGQNLFVEFQAPDSPLKPTFLFLPGVNRSLMINEPAAQEVLKLGYGVAAFHFSPQPHSVAALEEGVRPAFQSRSTTLKSLAEEVQFLAQRLKRQYGLKLVPVSLSYSGAVSRFLTDFELVIDTVPLTSISASNPQLASYRDWLRAGEIFNPVFGPGITRNLLDQAYRTQWSPQVNAVISQFGLPSSRASQMVEGYVSLSQAAEDFEWDNREDATRRTWILAEEEAEGLLTHQRKIIQERVERGLRESVVVVRNSGHVIPAENPKLYAEILAEAVQQRLPVGTSHRR